MVGYRKTSYSEGCLVKGIHPLVKGMMAGYKKTSYSEGWLMADYRKTCYSDKCLIAGYQTTSYCGASDGWLQEDIL